MPVDKIKLLREKPKAGVAKVMSPPLPPRMSGYEEEFFTWCRDGGPPPANLHERLATLEVWSAQFQKQHSYE
jgi:hypothetical protein